MHKKVSNMKKKIILYILSQFDVVVILYWGDAFLCGNFLPQVDEPWKYKIQHRKHAKEKMLCV